MTRSRSEAGFSLVELVVIVAILGVMAAIAIPSFKGVMPRIRLKNDTMILSNQIALARVRAISKSSDFQIVFYPNTADEYFEISKYSGIWQSLGTEKLSGTNLVSAQVVEPPPSTAAPVALNPANTIYLSGNGQATNVPIGLQAAIELSTPDGENRKRIKVESTGRMLVERWSGGAWVEE